MSDGDHEPEGGSARQIIAAVIALVLLVLVGLWLTGTLRGTAQMQDCVASGRTNCAPINR